MLSHKCPYCDEASFADVSSGRPRPETHQEVKCSSCKRFSIRHANGRVYPLDNPNDPKGDPSTRVVRT